MKKLSIPFLLGQFVFGNNKRLIGSFFGFFFLTGFGFGQYLYDIRNSQNGTRSQQTRIQKQIGGSDHTGRDVTGAPESPSAFQNSSVSAFDRMKQQGKKEDVSKRDAFSKHYPNEDGSYTAIITSGPQHYMKDGVWTDIDPKIVSSAKPGYPYENTANLMTSYFGESASKGVITKIGSAEVREFLNTRMYWTAGQQVKGAKNSLNTAPEVQGRRAYYRQIYGNIDAEFEVLYGKRKLNYIIPSKAALGTVPENADFLVFSEDVLLPAGWYHKIGENGDVEIRTGNGEIALVYSKPVIYENYNTSDLTMGIDTTAAGFEVTAEGQLLTFLLKVDAQWLLSAERTFPLGVDPTVTVNPNIATYWTGWATMTGGNNDNVIGGFWTDGYEMAGYSKFNVTSIPDNAIINSVQVNLYYFARWGDLIESIWGWPVFPRRIALVDIPIDPVPASYNAIFNSVTQYISSNYVEWGLGGGPPNGQDYRHWKNFTLGPSGISFVQDALSQNYATVAAFPYNNNWAWVADNYAWFRGYSNPNRPQMVITYNDPNSCSTPSSSGNQYYIQQVSFVGTLIPDTVNTSGYSAGGYGNYATASDPIMASQIPGGVININQLNRGTNPADISVHMKAWVDWNNNGIFDSTEKVYDSGPIIGPGTIYGFVVPAGATPGIYKIRLRTYRGTWYYQPCGPLGNGETEDYKFEVVSDCAAKITAVNMGPTDGYRCGTGSVRLTAQGSSGTTYYRWYDSELGGNLLQNLPQNYYDTPDISTTATVWVTAWNGSCESRWRVPVVATIRPTPDLTLSATDAEFCGEGAAGISITSSGGTEEYTLLNEKFNSGLGAFQNQVAGYNSAASYWQRRNSPYVPTKPPYYVVSPAIASGFYGGGFACAITDVAQSANIVNRLNLINYLDASQLQNLKVDFDLYYQPMTPGDPDTYLRVQASADNGANWNTIITYNTVHGNPGRWEKISLNLPNTYLTNRFRLRFVIKSLGQSGPQWLGDIAAIDNIRIYGDKPLDLNLDWTEVAGDIDFYLSDCSTPFDPGTGTASDVCIIPSPTQIETYPVWEIKATADLNNGCISEKSITITNNTKVWNPDSGTDWASTIWKPGTPVPDATNCVIVKKAVNLNAGTDGLAKNLTVKNTGELYINDGASLTVTDFIHNEAALDKFVVKHDGNLLQTNGDTSINSGEITVEKEFNFSADRKQYNFVTPPVVSATANMKTSIYSPNPLSVQEYNTSDDYFYETSGPYVSGLAYAVQESPGSGTATVNGKLMGVPFNGPLNYTLNTSGNRYNLIGNPYPSNLDVKALYDNNTADIESTFYFWDNTNNNLHVQQGPNYDGDHYAKYNASSNTGTKADCITYGGGCSKKPDRFVKVGTGFMVQSKIGAGPLNYINSYRTTQGTVDFFGKHSGSENLYDRYWLAMTSPSDIRVSMAVVYFDGGTDEFSADDTESFLGSNSLFSLLSAKKLVIQGRAPFRIDDQVPLGYKAFEAGTYIIGIDSSEGVFAEQQSIWLIDQLLHKTVNLSVKPYKFLTRAGEYNDRFVIVYRPSQSQGDGIGIGNQINISKIDNQIVISSSIDRITEVELFDLNSRPVYSRSDINSNRHSINASDFNHQIVVVTVKTETGEVVTRKFINN